MIHNNTGISRLTIDTIRTLSMDAVQKANSGHPGMFSPYLANDTAGDAVRLWAKSTGPI
jgi:hypothetical protein